MAEADMVQPTADLFRPSRKSKSYRKRMGAGDESNDTAKEFQDTIMAPDPADLHEIALSGGEASEMSEAAPSVHDILRHRKAVQRRRAGIEFTNTSDLNFTGSPLGTNHVRVQEDDSESMTTEIERLASRFAPQTGHVAETSDKHMMAYIDSELDKIHQQQRSKSHGPTDLFDNDSSHTLNPTLSTALPEGRQPASLGRIHEIDLGPANKALNVALTEAAKHRLQRLREGEDVDAAEQEGKPRLRRDGKPFRRRKRRNSSDVKRDKLVEEVLRESRLDIYDDFDQESKGAKSRRPNKKPQPNENEPASPQESGSGESDDEEAADDALAEQFRRDFLEQVAARRRQRQRGTQAGGAKARAQKEQQRRSKGQEGTTSRGPKLGGSRSARAKVRERQLEEQAAGKKGGR